MHPALSLHDVIMTCDDVIGLQLATPRLRLHDVVIMTCDDVIGLLLGGGGARDTLAVTSGLHVVSITHELISSLLTAVKTVKMVTSLSGVCVILRTV